MAKKLTQNGRKQGRRGASNISPAARPGRNRAWGHAGACAIHLTLIALVAIAAYSNTFHAPFNLDDRDSIVGNPVITDLPAFLSGAGYAYNPRRFVGYLSFAINYRFGGLQVEGYHAVNLAIHVLTAWFVYFLGRLTLQTPFFRNRQQADPAAGVVASGLLPLGAALLFVAHPVQTQAVTYIVQRLASLATLFYLMALVFYVKSRPAFVGQVEPEAGNGENDAPDAVSRSSAGLRRISVAWLALSLGAAFLALGTKEIAVTLPLVVLLYEYAFFGTSVRRIVAWLLPLAAIMTVTLAVVLQSGRPLGELLSDVNRITRETGSISRGSYLLTQFCVIVTYLRLLLFPAMQNLDYDYPIFDSLFTPRVMLSFLLLAALFAGAIFLFRRSSAAGDRSLAGGLQRLTAFGVCWFFIALSVESSVIPISDVIFEHRLYLPSIGAFFALAAGGAFLCQRISPRTVATAGAVIVAILAVVSWNRNAVWTDELTLWRDVAAKSPGKYRVHNNLASVLLLRGETDEALREYEICVRLRPRDADARINLGMAYYGKGWADRAIGEFLEALRLNPASATAHNNLGEAYNRQGLADKAISSFRNAIRVKPAYAEAHNNLGDALLRKGLIDQAIDEFRTAVTLKPRNGNFHFNLAAAYEVKGLRIKAAEEYRITLQLQLEDREARERLAAFDKEG